MSRTVRWNACTWLPGLWCAWGSALVATLAGRPTSFALSEMFWPRLIHRCTVSRRRLPALRTFRFWSNPGASSALPGAELFSSQVGIRKVGSTRVKWDLGPSFDPLPYLDDGELRAAYLDPEFLRLPKDQDQWPALPPAKVHASFSEFLKLLQKWDAVGALSLFLEISTDASERCGMFPVYKDEDFDRFILNPTEVNSRMRSISRHTEFLGQGFLLPHSDSAPRK